MSIRHKEAYRVRCVKGDRFTHRLTDRFWPGVASSNGLESAKSCGRVSRKAGAIQPKKIGFQDTLSRCAEQGVIEPSLAGQLKQLMGLRNPLSHFRSADDPESLFRRAFDSQTPTHITLQRDATFAIGVAVDLLASPAFRLGR